jgi:hypothetical protein
MANVYLYPMKRFKELESSLKQWFNIDKNTASISKCLSISFTADQLMQIQSQIPEEYRSENGNYDIVRYTYDHSDVLAMPFRDEINTNDLVQFFNNYEIEEDKQIWYWSAEMFEDVSENNVGEIKARTVDVGYCLKPYGHRMIGNVYQGVDNGKLFFTTVDGLNQYALPKDAIKWVVPHEE